jgi:hypothetical protein
MCEVPSVVADQRVRGRDAARSARRGAVGSYSGVPRTESGIHNTVAVLTITAITATPSSHNPNTNRAYLMDVEARETWVTGLNGVGTVEHYSILSGK